MLMDNYTSSSSKSPFPKWLVATMIVTAAGLFIASPFYSAYRLFQGIQQQDIEAIKDGIDFPALRESVKEELNMQMSKNLAHEARENAFAVLGATFAGAIVDRMVEMMVTPQGIINLGQGNGPHGAGGFA